MKQDTLWTNDIKKIKTSKMQKHLKIDTLIIGGGLAGISTLFELSNKLDNIALIERDQIGFGVTSRTTGKLTFMQGLCYHKLENTYNFDTAKLYLESQIEAIKHVSHIISKNAIKCNFNWTDAYVFTNNEDKISNFDKEINFYNKVKISYEDNTKLPFDAKNKRVLKTSGSAVFNPVKYLYHIANMAINNKAKIYEGVAALTINKKGNVYEVLTNKGTIIANTVIVATHYPFFLYPGLIPFKTHIEESFIGAINLDNIKNDQAINEDTTIESFRYYDDKKKYLLYSSESYKTSNHFDIEKRKEELVKKIEEKYHKKPDYIWHTHDILTNDMLPIIGPINNNSNFYIITGFNKWGMTNSIIASLVIKDLILKKENKYTKLFSSKGINLEKVKNFFIDGYQNAKSIVKAKVIKDQPFYHENVCVTYENGKRIGIYKDDNGCLHKVSNICPHMKCNLIFNNIDHTWDCPCHGSRFDIDGNVIEGPSSFDIKIKE